MTSNERFEDTQKARSPAKVLRRTLVCAVVLLMMCLVLAAPAGASSGVSAEKVITGADDLAGAKIGVQLGTTGDTYATTYEGDEAGTTIIRYAMGADAVQALKTNKIDCVIIDNITAENFVENDSELMILEDVLDVAEYAIGVKKGSGLIAYINEALAKLKAEGTIEQILLNYIGDDAGTMPYIKKNVERPNGVLIMATNAEFPPYEYYEEGEIVGIDADIAQAICDELGYELEIRDMSFDSIIPAILSGKADVGIAGMSVTDERLKDVDFTDSYASIKQVIIVRNTDGAPNPTHGHSCHNVTEWQPLTSVPADISSGTVYYYLADDVELSQTWEIAGTADVHLCLNGHDITFVGDAGSIVYVGDDASFSLYDCVETGVLSGGRGVFDQGTNVVYGGGVYNCGVFTMSGGSILNCSAGYAGGGVYNCGVFTMFGGSITNCSTGQIGGGVENTMNGTFSLSGGNIVNCSASYAGGGVDNRGVFTMSGGSISNCSSIDGAGGGGVSNIGIGSEFTLTGGTIVNCSGDNGGGVNNNVDGIFTMSDGSIINCNGKLGGGVFSSCNSTTKIVGGYIINCSGDNGGGVYNSGEFSLSSGSIADCTAEMGGGVENTMNGTFTMSGGHIVNCSGASGGGVRCNGNSVTVTISGGSISDCTAERGGGVYNSGPIILIGGRIYNCTAERGGGVYCSDVLTISGGTISDCIAEFGSIYLHGNGEQFTVAGSIVLSDICIFMYESWDATVFQVSESFTGLVSDICLIDVYDRPKTTLDTLVVTGGAPYASQFSLNETLYPGLKLVPSGNDLVIGTAPVPCDAELQLTAGWNFISIPKALDASNSTAAKLFSSVETAGNAILGYNAESGVWEQITADTVIKPLFGYWIYSDSSSSVPLIYSDVPTAPAMKQLYPGWNAVGLSADGDIPAASFFAGLKWRVALPWSCENSMYDTAIVNGGSADNSPENLLSLGNGCWLYVEEANVLPGLTE